MSTASATDILQHGHEADLEVSPLTGGSPVGFRNVWSVKNLPICMRKAADNVDIRRFRY
ncbi:hypothetical protein DPMN_042353 [Dreissena polymorpha]|uniref:Uncharacterized protein n=1 Tax=Dreissena polymorpha TaxID=45954 RepID=A0A9D4CZE0_DREPO|nr:hypothetical protein DPMN_042353 [Dreissena polymorpha]